MTDQDDVAQRAYHEPDPDRVDVRDLDESEDGMFAIRMPVSSTLEARDGDAFDEDRLRGWADQINEGTVGVFLDHGMNRDIAGSRYSGTGKLGYYADAEVDQRDDGELELVADTRMMDPDTLPEATGALREHLSRIKAQAERDIPIAQSVGWSDDVGSRDVPGGSDLLEGSIVGVASDPEASSHSAGEALARAAVTGDDRDAEQLVEDFRAVVMGSDTRDENEMPDDTDSPDDGSGDDRDGQDSMDDAEEFRDFMREQTETQTEILRTLSDALRADDEDDDEDEEENDDEDDDEDEDDDDGDRSVTIDGEEMAADEAVRKLAEDIEDADPDTPDDEDGERDGEPDDQRNSDPKDLL